MQPEITLKLSLEEAMVVRAIMGQVGGSIQNSVRRLSDNIYTKIKPLVNHIKYDCKNDPSKLFKHHHIEAVDGSLNTLIMLCSPKAEIYSKIEALQKKHEKLAEELSILKSEIEVETIPF